MAEKTNTAVRLSKAAKEFNIAVGTVVEFLAKKGHQIDSNPNSRLTGEQYVLLAKEYQSDKAVKQDAKNIDLGLGKKKAPITVDDLKDAEEVDVPESSYVEETELRIKKVSLEGPAPKSYRAAAKEESSTEHITEKAVKKTAAKKKEADEAEGKEISAAEKIKNDAKARLSIIGKIENAEKIVLEEKRPSKKAAPAKKTTAPAKEEKEDVIGPKKEVEQTKAKIEEAPKEKEIEIIKVEEVEKKVDERRAEEKIIVEAEKTIIEETPIIDIKEEEVLKEGKKIEEVPLEEKKEVVPEKKVEQEEKVQGHALKVFGKIDLTQVSGRGKRDKKEDKPKSKSEAEISTSEKTQADKIEEVVAKEETVIEETTEIKKDAVPDNFIPTAKITLSGPRLTGEKIDLGQFERKPKPVASSRDISTGGGKKKRPRTGEKKTGSTPVPTLGRPTLNTGNNAFKGRSNNAGGNSSNNSSNNSNNNNRKKSGGNRRDHVSVNNEEVEKTLKDTLARLSPLGKSKTSKHRREKRQNVSVHMEEQQERMMQEQKVLKVTEFVTVNELSTMMNMPVTEIISTCMSLGLFVSINQRLTADPISLLAEEYGYTVEFVDAEVLEELEQSEDEYVGEEEPRTPIVTIMGHVDHGKTSLLDYIRKTNVIAGEAGGITQHIGAYEVKLENDKKITFLDTPGHEAFTAMRARGAKVTDIAIIVISADDRIMPQTIEAINHAQAAGVPIVFAINKIDKPSADPDRIKTALAEMNMMVEEWGGKYQSQDISAKQGLNVELLLEKILLEAEMLELVACPKRRAKGTVIESSLDKGRGYVAKILVQDGSVSVGDPIIAGSNSGRVKAMYNERNQAVEKAGPSSAVLLLGLNGAPQAGDTFNVAKDEKEARDIASRRLQLQREQGLRAQKHITLDEIGRRIAIGDFKELNIIVKGDVDGSIEALSDSLLKLSTQEVQVNVIHKSVGQITESDIMLASASNAIIIGFQVRPSLSARKLAEVEQIDIRLYSIIYDAINELKDAIEGMLSPEIQEKIVANLEVREVYKISKTGTVAGCIVLDGKLQRSSKIRIIRDGIVAYTGKLGSLRRFKDDVKEVTLGQDCGLNIDNFNDIKVGDIIEGYEQTEVKRTL